MALEGPRLERQPGRIVIHPLEAKKVIPPFLDRLFQQNRFFEKYFFGEIVYIGGAEKVWDFIRYLC